MLNFFELLDRRHGWQPFCCVCRYFLGGASLPALPMPPSISLTVHPLSLSLSSSAFFFLPLCGQAQRSRYPWATGCCGNGSLWLPPAQHSQVLVQVGRETSRFSSPTAPVNAKLELETSTRCCTSGPSMFGSQPTVFGVLYSTWGILVMERNENKIPSCLLDLLFDLVFCGVILKFSKRLKCLFLTLVAIICTICVCFVCSTCMFKYAQV